MSRATYAVVIDIEAEIIQHPNGAKWLRLLLSQGAAEALYRDLGELLS